MIQPVFVATDQETRDRLRKLNHKQLRITVLFTCQGGPQRKFVGDATLFVDVKDDTLSARVHFIGTHPHSHGGPQLSFFLTEPEFKSIDTDATGCLVLSIPLVRSVEACDIQN